MTELLLVGPVTALDGELTEGLIAEDITVTQVSDIETAVSFLERQSPGIVLVHGDVPRVAATEFIRYVESNYPGISVLTLVDGGEDSFIDIPLTGHRPQLSPGNEWSDIVDIIKERGSNGEDPDPKDSAYHLAVAVSGFRLEMLDALKQVWKYRDSPKLLRGTMIVSSREVLENEICTQLTEVPGYSAAWVSHASPEGQSLVPTTAAGVKCSDLAPTQIGEGNASGCALREGEITYQETDDGALVVVPFMRDGSLQRAVHVRRNEGEFTLAEREHLAELKQVGSRFLTALQELGAITEDDISDRLTEGAGLDEAASPEADRSESPMSAGVGSDERGNTTADGILASTRWVGSGTTTEEGAQNSPQDPDEESGGTNASRPRREAVDTGRKETSGSSDGDGDSGGRLLGGSPSGNGGSGRRFGRGSNDANGWGRLPTVLAACLLILLLASFGMAAPGRYVPSHVNQEAVYCGSCHPSQVVELNQTSHLSYFTAEVNESYYNETGEHLSSAESVSASCMLCHNYWNRRNRLYAENFSMTVAESDQNTTVYNASYDRIVPTSEVPNATLQTTYVSTGDSNYTRMDQVWEDISNVSPSRVQTKSCGVAERGLTCHAAVKGYSLAKAESMAEIPEAGGDSAVFYRHSMMSPRETGTNRKQIQMCGACHVGKLPPSHASGVPKDREGNFTWTYSMNETQTLSASYPEPNWAHSNVQCIDCHAHARELNATG